MAGVEQLKKISSREKIEATCNFGLQGQGKQAAKVLNSCQKVRLKDRGRGDHPTRSFLTSGLKFSKTPKINTDGPSPRFYYLYNFFPFSSDFFPSKQSFFLLGHLVDAKCAILFFTISFRFSFRHSAHNGWPSESQFFQICLCHLSFVWVAWQMEQTNLEQLLFRVKGLSLRPTNEFLSFFLSFFLLSRKFSTTPDWQAKPITYRKTTKMEKRRKLMSKHKLILKPKEQK